MVLTWQGRALRFDFHACCVLQMQSGTALFQQFLITQKAYCVAELHHREMAMQVTTSCGLHLAHCLTSLWGCLLLLQQAGACDAFLLCLDCILRSEVCHHNKKGAAYCKAFAGPTYNPSGRVKLGKVCLPRHCVYGTLVVTVHP